MTPRTTLVATFALVGLTLLPARAYAQGGTDLYLVELPARGKAPSAPVVNLTARAGYDNQPSFTPDGHAVLYTVIDEAGQADIWRYDLDLRRASALTRTAPESEYSAEVMPGGRRISVVRVEADSTQRLWSFDLEGGDPRLVLEQVRPVGYYAWGTADRLALFVLGDPATLQLAGTSGGIAEVITDSIGRSIRKVPGRAAASYPRAAGENRWMLHELDFETGETRELGPAPAGSQDHAWLPDGRIVMGSGSSLVAWRPGDAGGWSTLVELADYEIENITRLAVSPDGRRVVVVADDGALRIRK